ncbi:hypothetical protein BpHYR1_001560 [Brachionus plicatilis]|uniref:Uncharacterized protein n=1 Tax=Brachionus plicatilis TaxID=10195 RepID=A0A3M7Q9G7_BRAPC|nr:hypothetical protein BpHYR1_001560 [Brachionus plicatilis]
MPFLNELRKVLENLAKIANFLHLIFVFIWFKIFGSFCDYDIVKQHCTTTTKVASAIKVCKTLLI